MIFVTVGVQLPFDRLIRGVDDWCGERNRSDVFAQVGASTYTARHLTTERFLSPEEFRARMEEARAIVAHAGIGTILTALELQKPLLIVPRRRGLGEHRNDHQVDTARHFGSRGQVLVAMTEEDLPLQLDRLETMHLPDRIGSSASRRLLERIRAFALPGAPPLSNDVAEVPSVVGREGETER